MSIASANRPNKPWPGRDLASGIATMSNTNREWESQPALKLRAVLGFVGRQQDLPRSGALRDATLLGLRFA